MTSQMSKVNPVIVYISKARKISTNI